MTTQPATIHGQRRYYTFEPLSLAPATAWKNLSHCKFAAAQALHNIRAIWDGEDEDTLIIAFANPQGERFMAEVSVRMDDATDYDEADPASLARFVLHQPGWIIESSLVRVSDQSEVDTDELFGTVDERPVTIGDIWPALQTLHACVCAQSDCIRLPDTDQSLFCQNSGAAADAAQSEQPAIPAERRVVSYEDYVPPMAAFVAGLSPREQRTLSCMANIRIEWEPDGAPGLMIHFIAPNELGYEAEVIPKWQSDTDGCWDVEIHSLMTTKLMKRDHVYYTLPHGEEITFDDAMGVLVALHELMTRCEEDDYPIPFEQGA